MTGTEQLNRPTILTDLHRDRPQHPGTFAIEVSALTKEYTSKGNTIRVVDNLTFTIAPGEVFSFLGPNGAGKTTTIKMICGLVSPTSGSIRLNGFDVAHESHKALDQIGVVLEGARNIYWRLSAWENLLYFGRLRGRSGKQLSSTAENLLRELGLWERRHEEVRLFSRGMQQKIAIASALVTDPPIILLDEPTLGLDVESAAVVEGWIAELAHKRGKSILLTTHQLDMAQSVSDRVAIIQKGHLIAHQSISELLLLFQQPTFEIKVEGQIKKIQYPWLSDLTVSAPDDRTTIISSISDQEAVYGLLEKMRELHLPLIAVKRNAPDLEEVFMRLLHKDS